MRVRTFLLDDHTMFREGLLSILSSREGIEVVGHSSTGEEAFTLLQENSQDVVIAQIDMDLNAAKEVIGRIREASPDSRIVVLTMFDNLRYVQALSKLGIDAYIHKTSSSEELVATIDALIMREPGGENTVVSMPRGSLERMSEGPMGALSERETEVLVLAARGLSNYQIATEMHLAVSTVKRHLANIYQKIGVGSRSEATRMALQEQWIGIAEITSADLDGYAPLDPEYRN
jgi:DNA-binding NarL/FixJ family response regulator